MFPKRHQKCNKKAILSQFCQFLSQNFSRKCFILSYKMWQKTVKSVVFVRFLSHLWNYFCQNLNTFWILTHFCHIFWQFLSVFWHILGFDTFLSDLRRFLTVICHNFVFWHIFDRFLLIFVTFLTHFWNGGTYIDKEYPNVFRPAPEICTGPPEKACTWLREDY